MRRLGHDLKFAARFLARNRATSLLAVLALALGIGAATAIFSVAYDVLFRPLPFPESERVVAVFQVDPRGHRMGQMSEPNFEDLAAQNTTLERLAVYSSSVQSITGGPAPVAATVAVVSEAFFDVLRLRPARGHVFTSAEAAAGASPTAVVTRAFWRGALAEEPDLATLRLRFGGDAYSVVGVLPPGVVFPTGADVFIPKGLVPRNPHRTGHNWRAVGRLRDGATLAEARADLGLVARRLREQYGDDTRMAGVDVVPLREALTGAARPALLVLLGAVVFLLLAACANVLNLLLAQAAVRQRELAVRLALGARRSHLVRQLVAETLVLAALAGTLGTLLAFGGVRVLARLDPGRLPRVSEVGPSVEALFCAVVVCVSTAVGLGLVTALRATRGSPLVSLADGQRASTQGGSRRLLDALVVSQVAATMALLMGAGLVGRSLARLLDVDPGFRIESALAMDVSLPDDTPLPARVAAQEAVLERLRALPGVRAAGLVNALPLGGAGADGTFVVTDRPAASLDEVVRALEAGEGTGQSEFRVASEGYFRALGISLLRGRLFEASDTAEAPHVAVVSQSFARRWPGVGDPVGGHVQFGNIDGDLRLFTIVGIVGDVRDAGLDAPARPVFYASHRQRPVTTARASLVVHSEGALAPLVDAMRRVAAELLPEVPPRFRTLAELRAESLASRRLTLVLLASFAAAALLLAGLGIYGVASYAVARRTREVGIRMALGARPREVLAMVVGESARAVAAGALLGLLAALALARFLASLLFGTSVLDPRTVAGVVVVLGGVALVASLVPARRATRVDPAIALRAE
jgi:putative ABC transport system permease protein